MPKRRIQRNNTNLTGAREKTVESDIIDKINDIHSVKRSRNNIFMGRIYRIDALEMTSEENGHKVGDFKVDVQTITRQKKLSETVAEAFVAANAPAGSLQDLKDALLDSVRTHDIYRVT